MITVSMPVSKKTLYKELLTGATFLWNGGLYMKTDDSRSIILYDGSYCALSGSMVTFDPLSGVNLVNLHIQISPKENSHAS